MEHADRLQLHRGDNVPTRGVLDQRGEALSMFEVPAEAEAESLGTLQAQERPEAEGPEPPPERQTPVPVLDHGAVQRRPQVARAGRHHRDQ